MEERSLVLNVKRTGHSGYSKIIISPEDLPLFMSRKWLMNRKGYVTANAGSTTIRFHREALKTPAGLLTDHINCVRHDNRRSNLRVVTARENAQNRAGARPSSVSGFRGVSYCKNLRRNPWVVDVVIDGKPLRLGSYVSAQAAAKVAAEFRAKFMPASTMDQVIPEYNGPMRDDHVETHCRRGHQTWRIGWKGRRYCRSCKTARNVEWKRLSAALEGTQQ